MKDIFNWLGGLFAAGLFVFWLAAYSREIGPFAPLPPQSSASPAANPGSKLLAESLRPLTSSNSRRLARPTSPSIDASVPSKSLGPRQLAGPSGATPLEAQADPVPRAITDNLRQFAIAAQRYMVARNITRVAYGDIFGTSSPNPPLPQLPHLKPVAGEDYAKLVLLNTTTTISVTTADGRVIAYNL